MHLTGKGKRQSFRVEELPLQSALFSKPFVESEIAVLVVHDDGIAELGEVKADLMQPAGFQGDPYERRF
jgi:hypothetical protein